MIAKSQRFENRRGPFTKHPSRRLPSMSQTRTILWFSYLACGVVVSAPSASFGQSTSSGSFGNRNLGGAYTAPANNFNGSAAARGTGTAATGVGGSAAGATTRGDAGVGQVTGAERFLRNNRQPGQFVGSDAADAQNVFSQLSGLGNLQQNRGQQNNGNRNGNNNGNRANTPAVSKARVQTTVGFRYQLPTTDQLVSALQVRLESSPRIERRGPISVRLEGRTAVLSGEVATAHDRELAGRVALLEAGVSEVRNDLTVAVPEPLLPPLPAIPAPPANSLPSNSSSPRLTPVSK
jgi:hypothetical protein